MSEAQTVYVLNMSMDYEGEVTLCVYETKEQAENAWSEHVIREGTNDNEHLEIHEVKIGEPAKYHW